MTTSNYDRGYGLTTKSYTKAIRHLMDSITNERPTGWPKDPKKWTNAQTLAERDFCRALAGDPVVAQRVIERAEGKTPQAPEDREAGLDVASKLFGGLPALAALQMALGLEVQDSEVVEDKQLPPVVDDDA